MDVDTAAFQKSLDMWLGAHNEGELIIISDDYDGENDDTPDQVMPAKTLP